MKLKGQRPVQIKEVETLTRLLGMGLVKDFSVAIDGGAHVGTWAAVMAECFGRVFAFEPTPETFSMLTENMAQFPNVVSRNEALMDVAGRVDVLQPRPKRTKLTARFCRKSETGAVPCIAIDDLALGSCGLIKLDLEGAEPLALNGARQTIKRHRPTLVIEVWGLSGRFGHHPEAAHNIALSMGYHEVLRSGVDRVYRPRHGA